VSGGRRAVSVRRRAPVRDRMHALSDRPAHPVPSLRARTPRAHARGSAGLALVEVIASIAILGILMTAVLRCVAAAAVGRTRTIERIQGAALAESLMNEILSQAYTDTTPPPAGLSVNISILGINVSLSTPGGDPSREDFDALDDYDGWTASPPIARDGKVIPGYTGWQQRVAVESAALATPNGADPGAETGLKRVTVIITRDGREISRMVALRSAAWEGALDAR